MSLFFSNEGWEDYLFWQEQDKKTLKKINQLIKDIGRHGSKGLGKSERLKHTKGYSKRIDQKNRLVFDIVNDEIWIVSCRGHYEE